MRKRYTISNDYKLLSGKYIVPQVKEIPSKFWGLVVIDAEVTW